MTLEGTATDSRLVALCVDMLRREIAEDRPAKVLVSFPLLDYLRKQQNADGEYLWQAGLRQGEPNTFMDVPIDRDPSLGRWSYRFVDAAAATPMPGLGRGVITSND